MRTPAEIRAELGEAIAQRNQLWQELTRGASPTVSAEVGRLTTRIDDLWHELRSTEVQLRHGPPEPILRRADRERRLELELDRRLSTEGDLPRAA